MGSLRPAHKSQPFQPQRIQTTQIPQFFETLTTKTTQSPPPINVDEQMTTESVSTNSSSDTSPLPLQSLSQLAADPTVHYQYLRLEWTESDVKLEYIARYSPTRIGFWLTSAPQRNFEHISTENISINQEKQKFPLLSEYRSTVMPKFNVFAGAIQIIFATENYMVLTFCELIPNQQLFSIILTRHSNTPSMNVSTYLNSKNNSLL